MHDTREELIDPRLSRSQRRLQRLLHVRSRAYVDAPLARALLGKSIRARACDMTKKGTSINRNGQS